MLPRADTATWIAVGFAVGAAVLALAASLILLVLVFRRLQASPAAPEGGQAEDPARALADPRAATARSRRLSEIASTIDLDAVLERTLAAAAETDGVDAAMAVVRHSEDTPIVAILGMTAEEAARQPVSSAPSGGARSVRISYRYDGGDEPEPEHRGDRLISGGVAVPLHEEHIGTIGTLAVFWRGGDRLPKDGEIGELEALARASGPAIRNAQEFRQARELADIDPLTGVHNRRYFHEALARECARAQRYDRGLALLVFDIEVLAETDDGSGRSPDDAVLAAVGERLRGVARQADVACRLSGGRFAVVLPEAGARDAEHLHRRVQEALGLSPSSPAERIRMSAGIAELRPEDDSIALFQRADDALDLERELAPGEARPQGLPSGWAD